jgi:hypothetical protein
MTSGSDDDGDATVRAIEATARDYYEGWFEGDAERMTRALHPLLAKRSLGDGEDLASITAEDMISWTAAGEGRRPDRATWRIDVHVDDVDGSIATATARGGGFTDYLHLVKVEDRWRILNVLWKRA